MSKVVIVGGGTAGWMAAATLSRAFGPALAIELVESDEIGTVGVGEATIPQIRLLASFLGLDEDALLREVQGTLKLGIEFQGWGRPGERYLHAFGAIGRDLGLLPFHHYWQRARLAGRGGGLWDYSLTATAARAGRAARADRPPEGLPLGLVHAWHFDATLVARYLRRQAERTGVRRTEGRIVETLLRGADGFIEGVRLDGDRVVTGELFIDCSGFRGLLIEEALHAGYEDWTHWLPCDRAVAVPSAAAGPPRPYTQAMARPAGWQWRIPLQHRVGNGHVYCSRFMSEDEATAVLLRNLEGPPLAEPRPLRFTTGRRKAFWSRNCVALGLASGFMEPLESTSIHLVQSHLQRLISLFPDRRFEPRAIAEHNRQCAFEFERIRDFLILHYHLNARPDEPFWRERREMTVPDTLAHRMALFKAGGRIFREADELFTETGWLQVMTGQGLAPEACHPLAGALNDAQLDGFLADLKTVIGRSVAALPSHGDFIARHCAAPAA